MKDGELKVRWSKKENDIVFQWGDGVDKVDAYLLNAMLNNQHHFRENSYQEELVKRGYDIKTLKISINKESESE